MTTLHGQPADWDESEEGHLTIYAMDPALVPADQTERVIYELRLDVARLNTEAMGYATALHAEQQRHKDDPGALAATAFAVARLLKIVADFLSEDGENPEYDRACVEIVVDFLGMSMDDRDVAFALLRSLKQQVS